MRKQPRASPRTRAPGPKQPESGEVAAAGSTTPALRRRRAWNRNLPTATATGTPEAGKPAEPEAAASTQSEGEDKGEGEKKNDEKTEPQQTAAEIRSRISPTPWICPPWLTMIRPVRNPGRRSKSRDSRPDQPLAVDPSRRRDGLKGGRRYVLSQTGSESCQGNLGDSHGKRGHRAAEQTPVAKLWRNEMPSCSSGMTRPRRSRPTTCNCILQPRVGGKTKFTALTEP